MLYFSTSNAAPDWNGADREGDNLFTASIVAMDAETGKYKWHYQQVHHDLWDYDAPRPTVLFDGEMNGEEVEAVGEPSKTGWVYLLDRKTGKPIYPIPEVKVPQDPSQKTSATQPEPTMEPFSPLEATPGSGRKSRRSGRRATSRNRRSSATKIFPPMSTDPTTINLTAELGGRWRQLAAVVATTRKRTCTSSARRKARSAWSPKLTKTEVQRRRNVHRVGDIAAPPASTRRAS